MRRTDIGHQAIQPELLDTPFDFAPRESRLVAEPEIQRQAASHPEIILGIHTGEDVAVVLKLSRPLAKGHLARVVPKLAGQESGETGEAELRGLEE